MASSDMSIQRVGNVSSSFFVVFVVVGFSAVGRVVGGVGVPAV